MPTTALCLLWTCAAAAAAVMMMPPGNGGEGVTCAKHRSRTSGFDDDLGAPADDDGLAYERCENEHSHCYTFWTEEPLNGTVHVLGQGCWVSSGDSHDCQPECVADKKPTKAMNNTMFCCCRGDMCNGRFAFVPATETAPPTRPPTTAVLPRAPLTWFTVAAIALGVLLALVFLCVVLRLRPVKGDVEAAVGGERFRPSECNLNKLHLIKTIGQGRYGDVWHGTIDDQDVAVKVFRAHHRNYYLNERELYRAAGESVALAKCFGGGERVATPNGAPQYVLVLGMERECLQEYLRRHAVDLPTLARMALGVARGLAHLHSDVGKACIAHRDLNTRNVLVRADLSCCVCDLGLAVVARRTENRSLSEAGTLRYMAPEVLEGAVNLRDCESALKQIDVYALGLVLWELGTRCADMQAGEPPPYAQPYEKEIGERPTLEQMQTLVSRHKARPTWPQGWRADAAPARFLAETAEDCWDQDAEARLTALCVEERLLELPHLRGRFHQPLLLAGSPTTALINNNHLRDLPADASVGTIETLLSPTDEYCKNSNALAPCVAPLQPRQGRNPCMERNLLTGSSDSLLVDKSAKHASESQRLIGDDYRNNYRRAAPIPYVQNAVRERAPKHNNVDAKPPPTATTRRFRWAGLRRIFRAGRVVRKDTQVKLAGGGGGVGQRPAVTTIVDERRRRPATLPLPDAAATLERFAEAFASTSDLARLKNPAQRVKTPGDVPPSVRRTRGKAANGSSAARFSLYDDRMMMACQWGGSAPHLEPPPPPPAPDAGSVSSF